MPFANYKDFNACILDQKKKGHSDESAHKICGYIKSKSEKNSISERLEALKESFKVK